MATSDLELQSQRPVSERAATVVMTLTAIGESLVGVVLVAMPREVVQLLIDAVLDARGLIVARMLGVAVVALGITWWNARRHADRLAQYSAGFIVYNLGVGALFGWGAFSASQPALPSILCVVHLSAGVAFGVLVRRNS